MCLIGEEYPGLFRAFFRTLQGDILCQIRYVSDRGGPSHPHYTVSKTILPRRSDLRTCVCMCVCMHPFKFPPSLVRLGSKPTLFVMLIGLICSSLLYPFRRPQGRSPVTRGYRRPCKTPRGVVSGWRPEGIPVSVVQGVPGPRMGEEVGVPELRNFPRTRNVRRSLGVLDSFLFRSQPRPHNLFTPLLLPGPQSNPSTL